MRSRRRSSLSTSSEWRPVALWHLSADAARSFRVGVILNRFKSGKLPKAIKVVPSLRNWEEIMYLTSPDKWSAQSLSVITRLFAANFNSRMAQRFYNLVLLPRIRDNISQYKRLNFHLYMAVRKAIFKPAAFFKGVLLPLAEVLSASCSPPSSC